MVLEGWLTSEIELAGLPIVGRKAESVVSGVSSYPVLGKTGIGEEAPT